MTVDEALLDERLFLECIEDNFYSKHVTDSTRDGAVFDPVVSSEADLAGEVTVGDCLGSNDHNMLTWHCHFNSKNISLLQMKLDFTRADRFYSSWLN